MKQVLLVGIGGFTGSIFRYLAYLWIDRRFVGVFPLSTFLVNVLGSLVLGFIIGLFVKSNISPDLRLFLGVGVCGSFTTFSTFAMENVSLIGQKYIMTSVAYTLASLVLGMLMAFAGYWIGKTVL
ncbi:MAG: fluoride efflux transporter CrcB [Bacteroidota bacterium]